MVFRPAGCLSFFFLQAQRSCMVYMNKKSDYLTKPNNISRQCLLPVTSNDDSDRYQINTPSLLISQQMIYQSYILFNSISVKSRSLESECEYFVLMSAVSVQKKKTLASCDIPTRKTVTWSHDGWIMMSPLRPNNNICVFQVSRL